MASTRRGVRAIVAAFLLASTLSTGCQSPGSYFQDRVLDFVDIWGWKFVAGKGVKLGMEIGYSNMSTEYDDFFAAPIVSGLRRHILPPNLIFGWYDFEKYGFQSRAAGVWRDKGIDLLGPVDRKIRAVAGNDYLYESVDEFNDNWRRTPERANVVIDYRQPKYHYVSDIHVVAAFLFGFEMDMSIWQFADFFLGWFHIDICKDDAWNRFYNEEEDAQPPPERLQRKENRASVETSNRS